MKLKYGNDLETAYTGDLPSIQVCILVENQSIVYGNLIAYTAMYILVSFAMRLTLAKFSLVLLLLLLLLALNIESLVYFYSEKR